MINKELLKERMNEYLNINDIKEVLGISEVSVYRLNKEGRLLPNFKWKGKNYWKGTNVFEFCIELGIIDKEVTEVVNG